MFWELNIHNRLFSIIYKVSFKILKSSALLKENISENVISSFLFVTLQ